MRRCYFFREQWKDRPLLVLFTNKKQQLARNIDLIFGIYTHILNDFFLLIASQKHKNTPHPKIAILKKPVITLMKMPDSLQKLRREDVI